ncbi:uncharacterized protein LOC106951591 [Poecilia latipinna]|uniref:uncharacterized protein LOC106951591 n=1 Tax=Poecilia latipinna TaxID=48699 RepID=UPI00072E99BF|nr:PREDICTED: uncharacterized protein LOC106951591 [Poecilia latipinna]
MLRRSARLQSSGYYNSEGVPTISYKEYSYRVFRKKRSSRCSNFGTYSIPDHIPCMNMGWDMENDSDAETIPYVDIDRDSDAETIPYVDMDMDSDAETIPYVESARESYAEPVPRTGFTMNTEAGMIREENAHLENRRRTAARRRSPRNKRRENIFLFVVTCLLIFALAYPIYAMEFTPEESPASSIAADMASSGYCKGIIMDPLELIKALIGLTTADDYCVPP